MAAIDTSTLPSGGNVSEYEITLSKGGKLLRKNRVPCSEKVYTETIGADKVEIVPVYRYENVQNVNNGITLGEFEEGLYNITFKKNGKARCDIYVNGVIKAEQKWLKENVNIMFQDGQLYALPLIYNIIMRPIQNKDADEKLVWDLLDKVGIASKIQKLPLTIYTPISNELDDYGTSFSGGEMQKILLARSLANTKLINIYDEVSNAMDVESKKDAVKLIRKYNKNTITIVVSHDNEWNDYVDQIVKL